MFLPFSPGYEVALSKTYASAAERALSSVQRVVSAAN
jgi:hypothetical protein